MERQQAATLSGIHKGHLERYFFAAQTAKGRVLDAACGCGYGSHILSGNGSRVVGIDIEPSAIEWAKRHYAGPGYICGDVMDAPWLGKFDYAVSFETIEHLPDPLTFLKLLKEDAFGLICSTPNQENYPFDPSKFEGDDYPHLKHYTPGELDALLEEAGWTVVEHHCQKTKIGPVESGSNGMFIVYVAE